MRIKKSITIIGSIYMILVVRHSSLITRQLLKLSSILTFIVITFMFTGCETGEIENLGGIEIETTYYYHSYILVEITLVSPEGYSLLWEESILNPQIGVSIIPEEEFDTNVKIYSLVDGVENKKVYDGRLADLHWNRMIANTPRRLIGKIPKILIENDSERNSIFGNIEVKLITPNQGSFTEKVEGVRIYGY